MFGIQVTPDRFELEALEPVREHWGWLLAVGVACLALGVVGLGYSVLLTITSTALFGVLVLVAGALQVSHALRVSGWAARAGYGALGVFSLGAAAAIFIDPLAASVWLTLAIASFLIAGAIVRVLLFFRLRGSAGRGWLLLSAIAGGVLGVLLFAGWPVTGLWFIGVAVAIDLMLGGAFWIATALRARSLANGEFAVTEA